jgi:Ice-binding-like
MKQFTYGFGAISRFHPRPVLFVLGLLLALAFAGNALGAATPVPLGNAGLFAVLAGSGITNTGASTINGDVGSSPTHSETGLAACPAANCVTLTGTNHNDPDPNDAVTQQAKTDLTTAYNNAAGQSPTTVPTELAGHTYTPGVYNSASGTFGMTGTLVLDGGGDPNAIFIFQTASTLITAASGNVSFINSAQACNVFWKVGSAATLGTGSNFSGTILAHDDISLGDGVTVSGRLLAGEQASGAGAVTLIHDTIKTPSCAGPPPADTTPPICLLTAKITGPPKQIQVTVEDTGSGLGSIVVTTSTNANTVVPPFTPGTTGPVMVTATKLIQTAGSTVALTVTDRAGNAIKCDPLWPGKKAAKPTSRVKHHRVGRGAAAWGRRTT